ncbi:hypothetical protein [Geomesophilobacter sediminis]|uniref:Uncharacterized protein n=1 Tax=Geomesophilobacter sediminis TaxID=2798584 RepID=A0A8J7IPG9_9BACT|nr:hypothetical protein [Geomesophilobacter sediminis]MBJ6724264.1 hypothetical protein [Geomesophilobacter sediminis]
MNIQGTAAVSVRSVDFYLDLPPAVVIHTDPDGAVAAADFSLTFSGDPTQAYFITRYMPASGNKPAQLHVIVVSTTAFPTVPFAILRYYVPDGAGGMTVGVESVTAFDGDGVTVAGIGVGSS